VKMFDAGKTRMIGLPYTVKNCDDILRRFHLIPERNGQTDGRTDLLLWRVRHPGVQAAQRNHQIYVHDMSAVLCVE